MKRALVISGGGSKGAFAVGAIRELLRQFPKLDFDIFVGTSTGALIAPLVAMRELDLLEELYTTQTTDNIILKGNIGDRLETTSIFDATPLWNLLAHYLTDENYDKLQHSGKRLFLTTTCLQTSQLVIYTNAPDAARSKNYEVKTIVNADHFRKAVMASACQPVFMPPIKVNAKVPGEPHPFFQYVDGGVREYAGIQMAIDNGATEIFTILLSVDGGVVEPNEFKTIFPILSHTIEIFSVDVTKNDLALPKVYNDALQYIAAVKEKMRKQGIPQQDIDEFFNLHDAENPFQGKVPISLFTIRPLQPLGGGPGGLNFDIAEMMAMLQEGQLITSDFIASLPPGSITWA